MTIKIVINPAEQMVGDNAPVFLAFLEAQLAINRRYFKGGREYNYEQIMSDGNSVSYSIVFQKVMLCRELPLDQSSQPTPRKASSFQFDLLGKNVGQGSFSKVFQINSSFEFDGSRFKPLTFDYSRVFKVQNHCSCKPGERCGSQSHNPVYIAQQEYNSAILASHLRVKPPYLHKCKTDVTFIEMAEMPVRTLDVIIKSDLDGTSTLTMLQRVKLTRLALLALKAQVTDLDLIHCDIKPKNIMVSKDFDEVNIVDYQFAAFCPKEKGGLLTDSPSGTRGYYSKEILDTLYSPNSTPYMNTPKVDVHAMGVIVMRLWSRSHCGLELSSTDLLAYVRDKLWQLEYLFIGISDPLLDKALKQKLTYFLRQMLLPNWKERISIDEAILLFEPIYQSIIGMSASQERGSARNTSSDLLSEDSVPKAFSFESMSSKKSPELGSSPKSSTAGMMAQLSSGIQGSSKFPVTLLTPPLQEYAFTEFHARLGSSGKTSGCSSSNPPKASMQFNSQSSS